METRHLVVIWAIWGEIVLIVTILTLYGFHAFTWSDLGKDFDDVLGNMDNDAGFYVGAVAWGLEYLVFLIGGSVYRLAILAEEGNRWFLLSSLVHVLYHVIRWPIFAALMVASLSTSTHETKYDGRNVTTIQVNASVAQVAVWFDFIVAGIVALGATVYASLAHCA
jgi:hypothetical protein